MIIRHSPDGSIQMYLQPNFSFFWKSRYFTTPTDSRPNSYFKNHINNTCIAPYESLEWVD